MYLTKSGVTEASTFESDTHEELLVNPTLLTLVRDGGISIVASFSYYVIRYGNFYQFVAPFTGGHISIAIEPDAYAFQAAGLIRTMLERSHIRP